MDKPRYFIFDHVTYEIITFYDDMEEAKRKIDIQRKNNPVPDWRYSLSEYRVIY